MRRHVYLIGMPGSGKSSVGRALGEILGLPFVDLDAEIEARAGMSIQEIFKARGENGFRDLEEEAVTRVAGGEPSVVACGGGAVLREENRDRIRSTGRVIWLHAPPKKLWQRIKLFPRPIVTGPVDLQRLARERDAVYRAMAEKRVEADGDPDDVARKVAEALV